MSKKLRKILKKTSGRDSSGHVSVRHQAGRSKRYLREIDWDRNKFGVSAAVVSIEYDPNRNVSIALLHYQDGEKRYILAPLGLKVGDKLISGAEVEVKTGNCLPLKKIPVGVPIHCLEILPGKGAKLIRSAGTAAYVLSKENQQAVIKLSSGELRQFSERAMATIGQLGNINKKNEIIGNAGRKRRMGIKPTVRGVAQDPHSHPHGGGEGRSGIGMPSPVSPWGKKTLGLKTRKPQKYSDKLIVKRRK